MSHSSKLLDDHLVVRIESAGVLKGVNRLGPLVADLIKAGEGQIQAPVVWSPSHLSLNENNSQAGSKVFATVREAFPPSAKCGRHDLFLRITALQSSAGFAS